MMRRLSIAVLLCLLSPARATAQEPATLPGEVVDEVVEEVRRYTVEFIVFEYSDAATDELFLPEEVPDPEAEEPGDGQDGDDGDLPPEFVFSDLPEETPREEPLPDEPIEEILIGQEVGLAMLDEESYSLNEIYEKLVELDAYRPMMRGGWTQAAAERDITPSLRLRRLGDPPLKLSGTMTLYLGRYLHLVVDVTLDEYRTLPASPFEEDMLTFGESLSYPNIDLYDEPAGLRVPVHFRIVEDRIVKNGDLRYFDHPKFGVLAEVKRFEEPEPEEGEPEEPGPDVEPVALPAESG